MPSLVEQLQRDATDPSVDVATLLRRAKVAASKLTLEQLESWMEHELRGYPHDIQVPSYRKLAGQMKAWNPFNGWIPIMGDPETMQLLCSFDCHESIGQIEDLLRGADSGTVKRVMGPEQIAVLNQITDANAPRYELTIGKTLLTKIVDEVRNSILDWALGLEKSGIVGSGFSFSAEDKQKAQEAHVAITIGSIGSFIGNMGSGNTAGDINASIGDVNSVKNLIDQLRPHLSELEATGADPKKLKTAIVAIDDETKKETVSNAKLGSLLGGLRDALVDASGSIIATGAIDVITRLLGH